MNRIFLRKSIFSLGLATIAFLSSSLSVSAQTVSEVNNEQLEHPVRVSSEQNKNVQQFKPSFSEQNSSEPNLSSNQERVSFDTTNQPSENLAPVPGTSATSSAPLTIQYSQASSDIAQADIDFGGSTRGGSSYVGVAGNIGLGGDTALGDGNFMIISKFGLTDILSVRPSAVLGDDTVILLPITYDFSFEQVADPFREPLPFSPYVGAGLAYQTGDDSELTFLLTGGVDVPLTNNLTATAAVNAAFFDETDLGLSVGVGYNFGGL